MAVSSSLVPWQSFNGLVGGSEAQGAKSDLTSTSKHFPRVTKCSLPYHLIGRP